MPNRLYVGNIPFNCAITDVEDFFSEFTVKEVRMITDRDTGRPRGFCFVDIEEDAAQAIKSLNGAQMGGRTIVVNEAVQKASPPRGGRGR